MKYGLRKLHLLLVGLMLGVVGFNALAEEDYVYPISRLNEINTYTVKKDGRYEEVYESLTLIENESGASNFGEQQISSTPTVDTVKIIAAYTIRPDGTHIKVPAKNIRSAKGDLGSSGKTYTDTINKTIIYPNVVVGSKLYLKYVRVCHSPIYKGQFSVFRTVSPHIKSDHFELNVNYDPKIKINFASREVKQIKLPDKDGLHRAQFTYQQPKALPIETDELDDTDFAPYALATSFASYEALGDAFQEKAKPKPRVTSAIQKLADEVTNGVEDKTQQVRLLYNWVSKNIRYIGSYVGNGGIVPHDSQLILDNRWGDCKDHVVIFEALLSAKGIESSPALINTENSYSLPPLPVSIFDHVITYVPSLDLYLDSTAQFAPFGTLPESDLDKRVILTGLSKMGKTPTMKAQDHTMKTFVHLKMLADGTIQGKSKLLVTGVEDVDLRNLRFNELAVPQDQVVTHRLMSSKLTGTGKIQSTDPSVLDTPIVEEDTFTLDPISNVPGPGTMPIVPGVLSAVINRKMMPEIKKNLNFPKSCSSFAYSNYYEIELPPNIKILHIPDNVNYQDEVTQYTSTYFLNGNKLVVQREFVNQNASKSCGNHENDLDKQFFPVFQRDMRAQVIYE